MSNPNHRLDIPSLLIPPSAALLNKNKKLEQRRKKMALPQGQVEVADDMVEPSAPPPGDLLVQSRPCMKGGKEDPDILHVPDIFNKSWRTPEFFEQATRGVCRLNDLILAKVRCSQREIVFLCLYKAPLASRRRQSFASYLTFNMVELAKVVEHIEKQIEEIDNAEEHPMEALQNAPAEQLKFGKASSAEFWHCHDSLLYTTPSGQFRVRLAHSASEGYRFSILSPVESSVDFPTWLGPVSSLGLGLARFFTTVSRQLCGDFWPPPNEE